MAVYPLYSATLEGDPGIHTQRYDSIGDVYKELETLKPGRYRVWIHWQGETVDLSHVVLSGINGEEFYLEQCQEVYPRLCTLIEQMREYTRRAGKFGRTPEQEMVQGWVEEAAQLAQMLSFASEEE